jgi:hypothetical protein
LDASIDLSHAHHQPLWHSFRCERTQSKTWLVTLHSPDRDRISRHESEGGDHAGLLALIAQVRAKAAKKLGGNELLRGRL